MAARPDTSLLRPEMRSPLSLLPTLLPLLAVAAAGNTIETLTQAPTAASPAPAGEHAAAPAHVSLLAYEQTLRLERTLDLLKSKFDLLYRSVKPLAEADLHVMTNNSDRLVHRRGFPWLEVLNEVDRVDHILGGLGELIRPYIAEEEEAIAKHGLSDLPEIVAGPVAVPEPIPVVLPNSYYRVFIPSQQSPAASPGPLPVNTRIHAQPQVVSTPVYPQTLRAAEYPQIGYPQTARVVEYPQIGYPQTARVVEYPQIGYPQTARVAEYPQIVRPAEYPHTVGTPGGYPHIVRAAQYPHTIDTPVYPQIARANEYPQQAIRATVNPQIVGAPVHPHIVPLTYVSSY